MNTYLADDELYLNFPDHQDLGEIKLEIWKVIKGQDTRLKARNFRSVDKIHELTKKDTGHHTR